MIVHKQTMGAIHTTWTGETKLAPGGILEPIMVPARLSDFPWLEPEEWWEIMPDQTALIKKILRYYPDLIPVTDRNGNLVDVKPIQESQDPEQEKIRAELKEEACNRGYTHGGFVRPKDVMPFLKQDTKEGEQKNELLRDCGNSKWSAVWLGHARRGKRNVSGGV